MSGLFVKFGIGRCFLWLAGCMTHAASIALNWGVRLTTGAAVADTARSGIVAVPENPDKERKNQVGRPAPVRSPRSEAEVFADLVAQTEAAIKRANLRGLLFASADPGTQRACTELAAQGRLAWIADTRSSVGGWVWHPPLSAERASAPANDVKAELTQPSTRGAV